MGASSLTRRRGISARGSARTRCASRHEARACAPCSPTSRDRSISAFDFALRTERRNACRDPGSSNDLAVELLGRYSKLDIATKLRSILAGGGRDDPPARTTRSVRRLRRLSDPEVDQLVERYQNGCSIHILARDFGIHRTTVTAQLKTGGVWRAPRRLTKAEASDAIKRYEQGWSLVRVADHFGVSSDAVRRALKRANVITRPVGTNQWSARS